jgi:hypothetical protein
MLLLVLLSILPNVNAFIHIKDSFCRRPAFENSMTTQHGATDDQLELTGVVAPLTYSGPYPCLGLEFRHLKQNDNMQPGGMAINFMMDTGSNINAIQKNLSKSLKLPKESIAAIVSAGAGGSFEAGYRVMLGDCHLSNMPKGYDSLFMRDLTAASIDMGLVVAEGLLGTPFFECFSAVEFDWYGTDGDPPTVIFYYKDLPENAKKNAVCVPLETDSFFNNVPIVNVSINGIDVRAMIDTGSSISIVSADIPESAGLERLKKSVKAAGIDKRIFELAQVDNATVTICNVTSLDANRLFIGEIPGMRTATAKKSTAKMPQAVIGLDVLKQMYRVILRLHAKELWIEEMPV